VQCIVTSPPYYGLRDYRGHAEQLGLERTPEAYVESLTAALNSAARVLRPDGTLWLNLGDSYTSRANAGPSADRHAGRGHRRGVTAARRNTTQAAPIKSLMLMPARVALSLQAAGWTVRNDIVWHKPNAMPESVTDRMAGRHEHLYLLTRRPRYYFDLDALREPQQTRGQRHQGKSCGSREGWPTAWSTQSRSLHPLGKNPGDVWSINAKPSSSEHFAMFPIDLPLRCISVSTRPGDLVLDPFAGMSTTGRAAITLTRRYVGIDVNPDYLEQSAPALQRLE
jgi:site-specific DNA-methyltransferase (cytosine-N4-specific)